jgi:hypothetical protein
MNPSPILDWVHRRLEEDEDIIVPLKKLWNQRFGVRGKPAFGQFARTVLRDPRFELVYSVDHDPSLEAFGLYAGPRVKLRSREITPESILRLVQKHNERVIQVLLRASEILRADSEILPQKDLGEAILMLEELRPALKPWVHLRPGDELGE